MTDAMSSQQIAERLTALHTALVEKLGCQPFLDMSLTVRQSGRATIPIYRDYNARNYDLGTAKGDTISDCLADAARIIAALPSHESRDLHDFMAQLGKLIDSGREKGIPVEFVNPLEVAMKRLASNALTHQREQVTA